MSAELRFFRARRIGLCGSQASVTTEFVTFCREVGRALAEANGTIIAVAGRRSAHGVPAADLEFFKGFKNSPNAKDVLSRIETFRGMEEPGPEKYFKAGRIIEIEGGSREARRFKMVSAVDGLIGIGGSGEGTGQQLTFAFAVDKPALPIPSFGGRSRDIWDRHRDPLIKRLGLTKHEAKAWEKPPDSPRAAKKLAATMVKTFLDSMKHRCFVIMPFNENFSALIDFVINPVADALGDEAIHLGRRGQPGDVGRQISEGISTADYAICVLDGMRPNVLYELGMAEALRKPVVLLWRKDPSRPVDVPFDIAKAHRIEYEAIDHSLNSRLENAIRHIKQQLGSEQG
jgi:hypothetical protein